jgi:hypothetical protein
MKMTKAQLIAENAYLRTALNNQSEQTKVWKKKYDERLNTQMLDARIKLANSLGQMIEATSKAVVFVIGKEVM